MPYVLWVLSTAFGITLAYERVYCQACAVLSDDKIVACPGKKEDPGKMMSFYLKGIEHHPTQAT